jgi:hypothetical protein
MQHHGSSKMAGPVRGTRAWWKGLGQLTAPALAKPRSGRGAKKRPAESGIRSDLVARVRREIAAGTYDTPEKWDAALDAMLKHLERD